MDKTEADQLSLEVLATPLDPALELQWTRAQLEDLKTAEQQSMCRYKLWDHVRDDAKMKQEAESLKQLRSMMVYCEGRLAELEMGVPHGTG